MSDSAQATRAAAPATGRASLLALVSADRQRMRRTWLVPLTLLGPLGVTVLGVIMFLLRDEILLKPFLAGKSSGWSVVVGQMGMVQVFSIGLGATLIASMIVDLEHRSDTWKLAFGLPVSRAGTYAVKFAWAAALLAVSSVLMAGGYALLMVWQHLGPLPWRELAIAAALPWVAVLPLLAFQLLLSTAMKNQALALTLGILGPTFGMGISRMPAWLPWRLMTEAMTYAAGGAISGASAEAVAWLTPGQIAGASWLWVVVLVGAGAAMLAHREIV